MSTHRTTVARLMALIGLIAVEAAVIRGLFSSEVRKILLVSYQVVLMALAAQVGVFLAIRTGGRWRRFWVGFTLSGLFVAAVLVFWPPIVSIPYRRYLVFADAQFRASRPVAKYLSTHRGVHSLVSAFLYGIPQVVSGLIGGAIAVCLPLESIPARSARMNSY